MKVVGLSEKEDLCHSVTYALFVLHVSSLHHIFYSICISFHFHVTHAISQFISM